MSETIERRLLLDVEKNEQLYALVPLTELKKHYCENYITMFQEAFTYLAQNPLSQDGTRVLHFLLGCLDMQNFIRISISDVATELKMDRSNTSKSIKNLVELGILQPGPNIGGNIKSYRLNPYVAWRGKHAHAVYEQKQTGHIEYEMVGNVARVKSFEKPATTDEAI